MYRHLDRFAAGKTVLDLGCGPGNTANEMAQGYAKYVGVDISEKALAKARRLTEENGRDAYNSFEQGDFIGYTPSRKFDVILFREALYHVPMGNVRPTLDRLAKYLTDGGVFMVRLYLTDKAGNRKAPARREWTCWRKTSRWSRRPTTTMSARGCSFSGLVEVDVSGGAPGATRSIPYQGQCQQ